MGMQHRAEVAVKFGAAALRFGLDLGAEIGAFLAVELDQALPKGCWWRW